MTTVLRPERSLLCLLGVVLALVSAGCLRGSVLVPDGPVLLDEMRADDRPYFWVGGSFEELELTHAEPYRGRFTTVIYGRCEVPTGWFADGGCAPPLSVQNVLCHSGKVNVAIYGDGGGRAARAAKALRPLNDAARAAGEPMITFDRSMEC